jgi:hypothetical protein
MSDFIWGLTVRNIENALWNGLSQDAMLFGSMAVAVVANALARSIIPNDHQNKPSEMKHLVCTVIGAGAGIYVSFLYADRLPFVSFAAEKALKFAVISFVTGAIGVRAGWAGILIGLITSGGALGYFGRGALPTVGAIGAVFGSLFVTGGVMQQSPKKSVSSKKQILKSST